METSRPRPSGVSTSPLSARVRSATERESIVMPAYGKASWRFVWADFTTHDNGPLIAGRRGGSGPQVLLLHGGPGLGFEYLRELADELARDNDVAWYQQRGLEPSAAE